MRKFVQIALGTLVVAALSAPTAFANTITVDPTPTISGAGPYTWTYTVTLEGNSSISSGDFFTIFDFAGFVAQLHGFIEVLQLAAHSRGKRDFGHRWFLSHHGFSEPFTHCTSRGYSPPRRSVGVSFSAFETMVNTQEPTRLEKAGPTCVDREGKKVPVPEELRRRIGELEAMAER